MATIRSDFQRRNSPFNRRLRSAFWLVLVGLPLMISCPGSQRPSSQAPAAPPPPPPAPPSQVPPQQAPQQVPLPGSPAPGRPEGNYAVVRVFYATDRGKSGGEQPNNFFSGERSNVDDVSFGTVDVSVPYDHRIGVVERPRLWRLEFREDPEKHMVLLGVSPQPESQFLTELAGKVETAKSRDVLVFIHGFAVTFAEAARRTAQMATDLDFGGTPVLYSWASKGKIDVGDYLADEATIEWTAPHLKGFLEKLATQTHASAIHVIAHSMGNRALVAAMKAIAEERASILPMFRQVFLAAPDIDAGVFRQLAMAFPPAASRVTLYASSKDKALKLSQGFHKFPRAGEAGNSIVVASHIDTVDATAVDTGLDGHSYYGDNRSILTDIHTLIDKDTSPGSRFGVRPVRGSQETYYEFRP